MISRTSSTNFFRVTSFGLRNRFCFEAAHYTDKFVKIHETLSNDQKIQMLFDDYVRSTYLDKFGNNPSSVEDTWIKIEAKFNQDLELENLTEEKRKEGEKFFREKIKSDSGWAYQCCMYLATLNFPSELNEKLPLITTQSENVWRNQDRISIPLTLGPERVTSDLSEIREILDQVRSPERKKNKASKEEAYALLHIERDAAAAIMLTSPLMGDGNCLFHEMGCWNGTNSIHNLMYCKSTIGRFPKYYLGTDINPRALGIAKMTFNYFDFPIHWQFFSANATQHFGLSSRYPDAQRIVQLALRVIPVLDFRSADALFSVASDELKEKDSYFVVSYALPEGSNYNKLMAQVGMVSSRWFEKFGVGESGTLFDKEENGKERVVNTFYSDAEFKKLVEKHRFKVVSTIRADEPRGEARNVSLLRRL